MIEVIKYIIIILHSLKYTRAFICVPNPPVQDKASHLEHVCTARDSWARTALGQIVLHCTSVLRPCDRFTVIFIFNNTYPLTEWTQFDFWLGFQHFLRDCVLLFSHALWEFALIDASHSVSVTNLSPQYTEELLCQQQFLEVYLEGTRSRSGKPSSARAGMLSLVVDSLSTGSVADVLVVPVGISYDRIIEGNYNSEQLVSVPTLPDHPASHYPGFYCCWWSKRYSGEIPGCALCM